MFLINLFTKNASEKYTIRDLICPIENDDVIPILIDFLSTQASREQINDICMTLQTNFICLRMNVIRFLKGYQGDLYKILFDLYLKNENNPILSIIGLLEVLLLSGCKEEITFDWLFTDISSQIRENQITPSYISCYLDLLKCFYNSDSLNNHSNQLSLSYFYFYPQSSEESNYAFVMNFNEWKELSMNGFGLSIWYKLPFKSHNMTYLFQNGIDMFSFNIASIGFSNGKSIIIRIELCQSKMTYKIIVYFDDDNWESIQNTDIDLLTHIYFQIDKSGISLYLNKKENSIKFLSSIMNSNLIVSLSLLQNFFGEVHNFIIYSLTINQNQEMIKDILIDYTAFTYKFLISDKTPINTILVYFPFANGDNIWNNFDSKKDPSFIITLPDTPYKGAFHYYSVKDTISKYYETISLLPIIEYLYLNRNKSKYIANKNILLKIFDIIPSKKAGIDRNDENFFFILSMFLEKMPDEYITEALGKKIFDFFFMLLSENSPLYNIFLNSLILNLKIIHKYPAKYDVYKQINIIQNGIPNKIWTFNLLIQSLLYMDNNYFKEFCCEKHRDAFSNNYFSDRKMTKEIMSPCLLDRIDTLSSIIIEHCNNQVSKIEKTKEDMNSKRSSINDLKYLTQLLYLELSPCLTIKLLEMTKKIMKMYNQDIFINICYVLSSPLRDIKNNCFELIISSAENGIFSKNNVTNQLNIGLLNYLKLNLVLSKQEKSNPSMFSSEYIANSIQTTIKLLLQFLLLNESTDAEEIIITIIDILTTINNKSEDNYSNQYLLFFIDLIYSKWKDSNVKTKLSKLLNDSFSFHKYIIFVLSGLAGRQDNESETISFKCLKFYIDLNFTSDSPSLITETPFIIVFETLKNNFSNINQIMNYHCAIYNIIRKLLKILTSQKVVIQNIRCMISIFKFYNSIESLRHSLETTIDFSDKNGSLQKSFMLNDELTLKFYQDILDYFSCYWEKEEYQLGSSKFMKLRKTIESIDSDNKMKILQDEIKLFTCYIQKEEQLSLILILSLMFNRLLNNGNVSNQSYQFTQKYQKFLCFTLILSYIISKDSSSYAVICSNNNEQKTIHTVLYEAFIIGFNCLLRKSPDSYDLLGMIFFCLDEKQYFQWKRLLSKLAIKKKVSTIVKFLCLMTENDVELMKKTFIETKELSEYNKMQFIFKENYRKKIELYSNQFLFQYQKCYYINEINIKKKKLSNNNINDWNPINLDHYEKKEEIKKVFYKSQKEYYLADRQKKMQYKKIKKHLFSWNKPWSNHMVFYPNELDIKNRLNEHKGLKVKLYNYYSQSFTRPFVIPIIDLDFYLPEITGFDLKKLFNDNDDYDKIRVNVNIDKILFNGIERKRDNDDREKNNDNGYEVETNQSQQKPSTNCLFDLLKETWNNNDYDKGETIPSSGKMSLDNSTITKDNYFLCCLVKPSRHLKGILYIKNDFKSLKFKPFVNQIYQSNLSEDEDIKIDYDQQKQTCFGAFIKYYPKDLFKDKYVFPIDTITHLFSKKYYFRHTAMEIFTSHHKSYYFNFSSEANKDKIYQLLKSKLKDQTIIIDYESKRNNYIQTKKDEWKNWKISNLNFLMQLNMVGNRSYNDITQYPVLPWILSDYSSSDLKSETNIYRDLTKPMGMLEFSNNDKTTSRKNEYIDNYFSFKKPGDDEENQTSFSKPFFFGSHYSNPIYTAHFLSRIFPMTEVLIELNDNKLDDPNRLFTSIEASFDGATTQKGDVRELIPEFYFLADIFINANNLNLGVCRNEVKVDNVRCPQWAENNPFDFVLKMRQYLENETVSYNLHSWIDLIFGAKQRGNEAKDVNNIFMSFTYGDMIKVNENTAKQNKEYYYRLVEFGLIPKQLFISSLESRKLKQEINCITHSTFSANNLEKNNNNNNLNNFKIKLSNNMNIHKVSSFASKLKCITGSKLYIIRNLNEVEIIKYNISNPNYSVKSEGYNSFGFTRKNPPCLSNMRRYKLSGNAPLLIFDKGEAYLQGGLYEGILILTVNGKIVKTSFKSPITYLTINKDETVIISGSINGTINLIDCVPHKKVLASQKIMHEHTKEIKHIFLSNELNAFASCSKDNYVHLFTFPSGQMIRSFYINQCEQVFLSDSPLPSIIIYSSEKGEFICYSINGYYLKSIIEENCSSKQLTNPKVIKNSLFFDYLIYQKNSNQIVIRSFPYMNIFKIIDLESSIDCYDVEIESKILITYSDSHRLLHFKKYFLNKDDNPSTVIL